MTLEEENVRRNGTCKVSEFKGTHTGQQELVEEQIKNKKIKRESKTEEYLQTYDQKSNVSREYFQTMWSSWAKILQVRIQFSW